MRKKLLLKTIFTIMLIIMIIGGTVSTALATTVPFDDVSEDKYYYKSVMWAVDNNITNGVSNTQFGVDQICTRAQGIVFLWRSIGSPKPEEIELTFHDVKESDYFYEAVCWGVENNIIKGYSDYEFGQADPLTRAQFVTMLWRSHDEFDPKTTINPFADVKESDYFYKSVLWASKYNITSGSKPNMFDPNGICLRAQAVTFLYRDAQIDWETEKYKVEIKDYSKPANAVEYGLSTANTGIENSKRLQALIDAMAIKGGTIYIPEGEYYFAENGIQTIGSRCIKMKSNVSIVGDGDKTILKPIGESSGGLDMFYFNEYLDTGKKVYLENCNFENFVIDSANTHAKTYTSAGKGFMFNLFKNCNWKNVKVMNTDGTGFGVDCPIGGSMENCVAINCGKAANTVNVGASGFGIGYGVSDLEHFTIKNCQAIGNKKFGFFFEHQGRFSEVKYPAEMTSAFVVSECVSEDNYYNFGGIIAMNTVYINCESKNAIEEGYYFEDSRYCAVLNCSDDDKTGITYVIAGELSEEQQKSGIPTESDDKNEK